MKSKQYRSANKPIKKLRQLLKKHSGRNNNGGITVRHQGGRQKRFYRMLDFKRVNRDMFATVIGQEYDPNRSADIALVEYKNKQKSYILHIEGLKIGDKIIAGDSVDIKPGNALPLKNIPLGISIHNLELYPGAGGQLVRSAGSSAAIIAKDEKYADVKLPSKEVRKILLSCYATIGQISNIDHKLEKIGKAGRKRLMGIRPTVRGVAQNPHSHPHGGGEGRSGQGMHPKTSWGKSACGKKTRKNKRTDKFIILRRN